MSQGAGEVRGTVDRAKYMLSIAPKALADVSLVDTDKPGFKRYIKRTPLGVVLVIAPWKYVRSLSRSPSWAYYHFAHQLSISRHGQFRSSRAHRRQFCRS